MRDEGLENIKEHEYILLTDNEEFIPKTTEILEGIYHL